MREFVIYTVARIALFVAVYAALGGIWMLFADVDPTAAFVILILSALGSSILSMWLLRGPREALAARVHDRAARASARVEEMRAREDVD